METNEYPVLPLRNTVIMPHAVVPIGVGRPKSIRLVEDIMGDAKQLVLLSQKDPEVDEPGVDDLYTIGTLATIVKVVSGDDSYTVIVQGSHRVRLVSMSDGEGYFIGEFEDLTEARTFDDAEMALIRSLKDTATDVIEGSQEIPSESVQFIQNIDDPSQLTDFLVTHAVLEVDEKQKFLENLDVNSRLDGCLRLMTEQIEITKVSEEIRERMREETDKNQKEYYLRQQLKAIQEQLGTYDDVLGELETRIEESGMPEEARVAAQKQLDRLQSMQQSSSEYSVTLNYVEVMLDIPWGTMSEDNLDLDRAQTVLDSDHYGLDKVKNRVVEYLAVCNLKNDMKGPILCLHGPPGVGKTSLGRSIARTLGRKFHRVSLGGMHDESEIRGHRRTYVGALPGRIARSLIKSGTMNPVILLDEIDKVGNGFRGDPSAALLEVLDPEQNYSFSDHYLEVDLDLSKVLFIATANQLDTISPPLRDRMEIIDVPSYTLYEKQKIAEQFLVPKQIKEHGITKDNIEIPGESIRYIIDKHTREAGVRNLERRIAGVCRTVAVEVAKADPKEREDIRLKVDESFIQDSLGPERHLSEMAQRVNRVGVVTGLAWTQAGGDILFIEAQEMPGKGELKLTGQLGDVMKESVHAALSYIRSNSERFGVEANLNEKKSDIHLHVPAGAIPKDGPSAGITMFSALLSRLTGVKVRKDVAMTGEITLSGNILPVGGIKEKVIAAHRAGITTVIMPAVCKKDLVDVDESVKADITFHFVDVADEVLPLAFETNPSPQD